MGASLKLDYETLINKMLEVWKYIGTTTRKAFQLVEMNKKEG